MACGLLVFFALAGSPARAQEPAPGLQILDLPFRVRQMRGPGSEVALAVATAGLLPVAKAANSAGADKVDPGADAAPLAVVWGEEGGAVLRLAGGRVEATLIGAETIEGIAAAETPRGAVPGTRRALSGAVSAYLTGATRAGGEPMAAALTVRERQPLGVTADPRPVPVATTTVTPGADAVLCLDRPRALSVDGRPALVAVTHEAAGSRLALIAREAGAPTAPFAMAGRGAAQSGACLKIAALADFSGDGGMSAAVLTPAGGLQLWSLRDGAPALGRAAPGPYAAGSGEEAAAAIVPRAKGPPGLALPVAGAAAVAILDMDGEIRERTRIALPAPAASGLAALGRGNEARLLVGLADGRVAAVSVPGGAR